MSFSPNPSSLLLEFLILIELAASVNPSGRQLRSGYGWSCVCAGDCNAVIPLVSGSGHLSTRVSLQLRLPWGCVGVIRWGWLPRGLHGSCMGLIPLAGASVRVVTTIETPYWALLFGVSGENKMTLSSPYTPGSASPRSARRKESSR